MQDKQYIIIMQIDPMTFTEFLPANGDGNLARYLETVDTIEPIPDAFFNPLCEKLKMYYVTGGMPVWRNWILPPLLKATACSRIRSSSVSGSLWIT